MSDALQRVRQTLNYDGDGYKMRCDDEAGTVCLTLYGEKGRVRRIGRIVEHHEAGVIYTKRVKDYHTYNKNQGWGLNMDVLNALNEVGGSVLIVAPDGDYTITAWGALAIGDTSWYKRSNCEKQVFVPKKNFVKTPGYGRRM